MTAAALQVGLTHSETITVPRGLTVPEMADRFPGFAEMPPVFATAYLVAFVEWTCLRALAPFLRPGQRTVGTRVELSHDAATPIGMQATADEHAVIDRVLLDRPRWTAIRSEVQRAFNARLNGHGLKPSAWKVGDNPVDRLLGKELCVLAWAVEHMEIEKVPVAVRNWLALRPEERWWLFGMTAMSTGGINDSDKGWRLALRHALGDIAQSELLQPKARRQRADDDSDRPTLDLFGNE